MIATHLDLTMSCDIFVPDINYATHSAPNSAREGILMPPDASYIQQQHEDMCYTTVPAALPHVTYQALTSTYAGQMLEKQPLIALSWQQ